MSTKLVSVVIPCFNNQGELKATVTHVLKAVKSSTISGIELEFILVDDGSTDGTWQQIAELNKDNFTQIKGVRLLKNVGAFQAILAGFVESIGEAVVVMAADGDDPPSLVPELIKEWMDGKKELVQANRANRDGGLFGSIYYSILRGIGLKNIPNGGSDFALTSRNVLNKALNHGWLPGNSLIQLFQHTPDAANIPYSKNRSGRSSWSLVKKGILFFQTIYYSIGKHATRPADTYFKVKEIIP